MAFTRIIAGRSATLTHTFTQGASPVEPSPDNATVTIVRDDGTVLVPAGSVDNTGTGVAKITLTPAETAQLDRLRVTWTATLGNQAQSFTDTVEIAGDTLFTIAELQGLGATDDQIAAARTRAEQTLEDACHVAFVPRYDRARIARRRWPVKLRPELRTVRWVKTGGVAMAPADVAALMVDPTGFVGLLTGYGPGSGWVDGEPVAGYAPLIEIGYEHGMDRPPEPVRAAALELAASYLDASATTSEDRVDPRAERVITVDGTLVFGSGMTGLPSVDRVIESYRYASLA